jgi:amidophosphoribosyltransferase
MCGIHRHRRHESEVAAALYDGLTVLQHRGQDAAGIATVDGTAHPCAQGQRPGARRVRRAADALLSGRVGIAHCRYPTAG